MPVDLVARRTDMVRSHVRKLVRRGALNNLKRLLAKVRPEEVPALMEGLTQTDQLMLFGVLMEHYPESTGEVLTTMESPERRQVLEALSDDQIAGILERVPVDDAVLLVESLPAEARERVLELVDLRAIPDVQDHLAYDDDTAGRIMTSEFFSLPQSTQVGEAIAAIQGAENLEMIFYLFVVDDDSHLVGVTSLRQLLLSPPNRELHQIMTRSVIKVDTDTDQERVAELAARYDLLAIPVTDLDDELVGIVTVDDIIDVFKEEADEDFFKMVGTSDNELLYQQRSWRVVGIRLPWILVNGLGLLASGYLLVHFQMALKEALFLLLFVPVIMGIGGNIGSQTSTIAVRSIASGRLRWGQGTIAPFLWQQVRVGALLGGVCAVAAAGSAFLVQNSIPFALVVGSALFLVIVFASLSGATMPVVFDRLGVDPAVAAGPIVTTVSDLGGILIYFGLALAMLVR